MAKLGLDRALLARLFQNNHQAIVTFEKVVGDTSTLLPETIEEAAAQANQALALATQAMAVAMQLMAALEAATSEPAYQPQIASDDTAPAVQLGTLASQNADTIDVTGGALAGVKIDTPLQIGSTLATGTAPFAVASTTRVANLNVATAGTADGLTSPTTLPAAATDLPTVITLANALRTAAIAKGL